MLYPVIGVSMGTVLHILEIFVEIFISPVYVAGK